MNESSEKILFLTGKLAEKPLHRVLETMDKAPFEWRVRQIGVSVAALMTSSLIQRRLEDTGGANRVLLPGRMRGDLKTLSEHYRIPFQRGPDDLVDLPQFFRLEKKKPDLSRYDCHIFAEIEDAPSLTTRQILAKAHDYRAMGANVIDLGCLPDTSFPHMEEAITALHEQEHEVSVDSADDQELKRAIHSGVKYLLSLHEKNITLMDEGDFCPVLIPAEGNSLASLERSIAYCRKHNRKFYADPILEPIHYGFSASLRRYHELRRRHPDIDIMMGLGNLTELTDVDSAGMVMAMMGIVSELNIGAVLCLQVSPHCRRVIAETDRARRLVAAAKRQSSFPKNIDDSLISLHDKKNPHHPSKDIEDTAAMVRDRNYRIMLSDKGMHLFSRDMHHVAQDPFDLFEYIDTQGDCSHAFYLGVELARAQIAHQLGKRYVQDEELAWRVAVEKSPITDDKKHFAPTKIRHRGKGSSLSDKGTSS